MRKTLQITFVNPNTDTAALSAALAYILAKSIYDKITQEGIDYMSDSADNTYCSADDTYGENQYSGMKGRNITQC